VAVALDSSAVIGFLDRGDAFHPAADAAVRAALMSGQSLHVSVITYAEVLTGAKLGHRAEEVVRGFFEELVGDVIPVDAVTAERAAELRGESKALQMPDALILASADLDPGVERILCADRTARSVAGSLRCEIEGLSPQVP
jgi:predicted nucleic acid-binding protein